ncbi:patatin-like phospholipase family protein [Amphiplicatus metriothermophilus]|uniref:NTE family protein n=1 Tax=Amphiplicatus metriothermophilus TaxID=1519374 RepID=A0A239PPJ7_9PROT|nr:patatin-like phospholipase family protein [Amphiplicatus metriothermophilus]MBB5518787.1 NTE family protein [Amphiplicatus metriothermophilus]SNT72058.1 NTE family protein [Amphiplicatus metriothermophilus]
MAETVSQPSSRTRPAIGLALGGGVARGWAHIGAVQRLSELGVRPDVVCGTSVGALVGGFWLAGRLPELEAWARSLTRRRMLAYFDLLLNGSALMGGKRLRRAMREYLGDLAVEDLPAKFAAITAELTTGHETWLTEGPLADVIEASYALPGVFPPRIMDGRWLIDGALVNPLPVSACRALGARLVIAVGLHADAFTRASLHRREKYETNGENGPAGLADAPGGRVASRAVLRRLFGAGGPAPGLGSVMLASFNIVMDRITRSRLAGDPPDVLLAPAVGHVGLLEFDRAGELIALGRRAVDEQADAISSALEMLA